MSERYLDTAELAYILHMSEDWVRDHAGLLGGVRAGDGPRGALRFERTRALRAFEARRLQPTSSPTRRRPGPSRRSSGDVRLLPLPGGTT